MLDLVIEEEDEEDITVQALTKYQTSLIVPRGIFNDNFEGENDHPPDHGKWIRFFCGEDLMDQGYGHKYCDLQNGKLRMEMNGDGGDEDDYSVGNFLEFGNALNTGYLYGQRSTQPQSGTLKSISFYSTGYQNVQVALYSSSGNLPNAKLTGTYTVTGTSVGWNTVEMDPEDQISLTGSTQYWIVFAISGNGGVCYSGIGGNRAYISSWSYGTAFPNPWVGGSYDSNYNAECYWTYSVPVVGGYFWLNCMTRAEFKVPFTTSFQVEIKHHEGQCGNHFMFSFVDSSPQRGNLLSSKLYGDIDTALWAFDEYEGIEYCWVLNGYCGTIISDENAWEPDHIYNVSFKPDPNDSRYLILSIADADTSEVKFETNQEIIPWWTRYVRAMFSVYEWNQTFTAITQFYVDNFNVVRSTSKKVKCAVTFKNRDNDRSYASDDVNDITITLRDGCYPSASVVLDNKSGQYNSITIMDEIEIRAGWEHMMWLLFRGYIDTPEFSFPPAVVEISSSKGFASALEFRETNQESWEGANSADIVHYLIEEYYSSEQFTADWISDPDDSISIDSDDEPISEVLQKLAEMNGYIVYVDFNKSVNYVDPDNDTTQTNLRISQAEDVVSIKNRLVDSIVNRVTVKGATDTVMVEDETSQAIWWLRERTWTDGNLTSLAAVTARANELLAKMKDPYQEVPIVLPEFYILELNDLLSVYCEAVGLDDEITVKGVTYNYSPSGLRTQIYGLNRGFSVSDVLSDHDKKLKGIT